MSDRSDPPPFKNRSRRQISSCNVSTVRASEKGFTAFSLPSQFAPRSESANRTLANSLPGTFVPLVHDVDTRISNYTSPIFGPYLLRPNGCMGQDATWYGGRPRPRRLCVKTSIDCKNSTPNAPKLLFSSKIEKKNSGEGTTIPQTPPTVHLPRHQRRLDPMALDLGAFGTSAVPQTS